MSGFIFRRDVCMQLRGWIVFFGLWLGVITVVPAQEFRAAWADVFHSGMGTAAEVDAMVSMLATAHYNVVIVQVLGYMDNSSSSHGAYWKSSILPRSNHVTSSFDPLAYLCQKAHASGIEVHAWLGGSGAAMYRVSTTFPPTGNSTLAAHPEWFIAPYTNSEGGAPVLVDGNYALDMGSPDVQEYIVSIVRELVANYAIDGINWDDELNSTGYAVGFGYPAYSQASYSRSGLARFRLNTGFVGTPTNTNVAWSNYRRRFKNELMARVQAEMESIKTNPRQPLRHTTAALAYSPVPASSNFVGSVPYTYFCDWAGMLQNGWVDAAVPQTYSSSTFTSWADRSAAYWQYNRQIFPGIGAYLDTDATIASQITYTRGLGLKGNSIYSYAVANNSSPYNGDWWSYVAANLYTNTVSTPVMPWRNPATATEGIFWGRVKNNTTGLYLDDATVTVTGGPTVQTDGNGYYIATLVPATGNGTAHFITASKAGSTSQSASPIALPGDVVRFDFLLNGGEPSAPNGLAATSVSAAQINLSWNDNATNESGYVVSRATVFGGPYSDVATLPANFVSYTDFGLSPATTYYYLVRATNAIGASATSAPAAATTFTNTAPLITAQPQDQSVVISNQATFSVTVTGTTPITYQWQFNDVPIPGATFSTLTLGFAQYSDGGNYSVMVSNSFGVALSSNALLTVLTARPTIQLSNLWNIQAGSRAYVTSNNTERGLCLNPITGHALLVSRSAQVSGGLGIFILDANTGAQVGTMSTNGINNTATFALNKIDVAGDGVIYGANLTTASSTSPLVIYRWAGESAIATAAYSGAPDSGITARWGDSFSVTGAGAGTRILVSGSSATNAVLFTTSDGTNFTASALNPDVAVSTGEFSRGLQLVGTNFYSKNSGATAARVYSYNAVSNRTSLNGSVTPLDSNLIAICVATNYGLLAGIVDDNTGNNSGHSLKVYDIFAPNAATTISNFNFLTFGSGTNSSNANFAGAVDTDGTRIVALDTQNGVIALQIIPRNAPPRINSLAVLPASRRQFQLNVDPGNFVIQASSDLINWLDLAVARTNGIYEVIDPVTNAPVRYYRTKN